MTDDLFYSSPGARLRCPVDHCDRPAMVGKEFCLPHWRKITSQRRQQIGGQLTAALWPVLAIVWEEGWSTGNSDAYAELRGIGIYEATPNPYSEPV